MKRLKLILLSFCFAFFFLFAHSNLYSQSTHFSQLSHEWQQCLLGITEAIPTLDTPKGFKADFNAPVFQCLQNELDLTQTQKDALAKVLVLEAQREQLAKESDRSSSAKANLDRTESELVQAIGTLKSLLGEKEEAFFQWVDEQNVLNGIVHKEVTGISSSKSGERSSALKAKIEKVHSQVGTRPEFNALLKRHREKRLNDLKLTVAGAPVEKFKADLETAKAKTLKLRMRLAAIRQGIPSYLSAQEAMQEFEQESQKLKNLKP